MNLEILLLSAFFTLFNSVFILILQRWLKTMDERHKETQNQFSSLCRKIDVLLHQNNNMINAITYIIVEHAKNHGSSAYLDKLLENLEKRG